MKTIKTISEFSIALLIFFVFLSSCNNTPIIFTPTAFASSTPVPTSTSTFTSPTYSPSVLATIQSGTRPLPTSPIGYPTSLPPFEDEHYIYDSIRFIDKYVIKSWHNPYTNESAITISHIGQPQIDLKDRWIYVDELSGIDLTNEGVPSLIIRTESGGGICCSSTIVYNLGEKAKNMMDVQAGNTKGYFIDLNNDGVDEFIAFEYWHMALVGTCMACMQPIPIVLRYRSEIGYVIASPQFQDFYNKNISHAKEEINTLVAKDPKSKSLIDLVGYVALCYIYSGQTEKGWAFIDQYYPPDNAAQVKLKIQKVLQNSTLYIKP